MERPKVDIDEPVNIAHLRGLGVKYVDLNGRSGRRDRDSADDQRLFKMRFHNVVFPRSGRRNRVVENEEHAGFYREGARPRARDGCWGTRGRGRADGDG